MGSYNVREQAVQALGKNIEISQQLDKLRFEMILTQADDAKMDALKVEMARLTSSFNW